MSEVEVRYARHGEHESVWVLLQPRLDYIPEWICVASTDPGTLETRVLDSDPEFRIATMAGTAVPFPLNNGNLPG